MKKFLFLFLFFIPFISFADNNNDYCKNSNQVIDNLIKSNDYDEIYYYLRDSYTGYYNKCGNTDKLNLLINKYISLIGSDSNHVSINDDFKLFNNIRPFLKDDIYDNFIKNIVINNVKYKKSEILFSYYNIDNNTLTDYNNYLKELDENFATYYKIDKTKFCGIDGEGSSICTYKYIYNKPLKVSGTLTVSNIYNENTDSPNYFKASFKANNLDIDFSKLFLVPVNYKLNTQIPKNYLQTGAAGEITFNVDFTLDIDSIIEAGESPVGDITTIYVKDLNINSVNNIKYYDKLFIESFMFSDVIKTYQLKAEDDYTNIRDKPNGKVVYQIKFNDNDPSDNKVYFYEGYIEPGMDGYRLGYGYPPDYYLYNYYKILGFSKAVSNDWYFITYFPKNSTKPVFGYIHSSEIIKDNNNLLNFEFIDNIENINALSYKQIFDILHDFIGEDVYEDVFIKRLNYINNTKLQSLVDRYVSFLLNDSFIMRNTGISSYDTYLINSLYYYISDDNYYKILNKYSKDIIKYEKLYNDTLVSSCKNTLKSFLSSDYMSYFKIDTSNSGYLYVDDNDLFINNDYGIYDINKFINDFVAGRCVFTYNASNPMKIHGNVIVDTQSGKLSFNFKDIFLNDNISIYPLNYSIDKSAYSNLLNKGYLGKVSFDAELTLLNNTLLVYSDDDKLFVDNIHINGAKNITYYNSDYYKPGDNKYFSIINYDVSSINGSAVLLDFPNGKTITNIKNGSKVYFVNFNINTLWDIIFNYKGNNIFGKYYRVIYFPDGVTDGSKALSGYIDSSNIKKAGD